MQSRYFCLMACIAIVSISACEREAVQPTVEVVQDEAQPPVGFPVSCSREATAAMQRGVADLHNMMYITARGVFEEAASADPDCVMAHWGVAMTYIHPLWNDAPTDEQLGLMEARVRDAVASGAPTPRERAYLNTVHAFFENSRARTERERLTLFEAAWRDVYENFSNDLEAQAFYSLAYLATADPNDKSYVIQNAAGAIAEGVLAAAPDHPGAHHYVIHSYDFPGLAERALPVAMNYGNVAPETAHPLHMMSHIFTRLGMWDESIEWNRRAADAAWKVSLEQGGQSSHYQHALDYLGYAYLQKALDDRALAIVAEANRLDLPYSNLNPGALGYALSALPARYALERRDWAAAAALEPNQPTEFPWERTPEAFQTLTHYARALGLAREQRFDEAAAEIAHLESVRDRLAEDNPYWAAHAEIKAVGAMAWLRFEQGAKDEALALMRRAGELEAATDKNGISPGYVLPARELLGDMLLELENNEEALAAYEATLAHSPGRLNSLYGMGLALEGMGETDRAAGVYEQIIAMTAEAGNARPWLSYVKAVASSQ